MKMYEFLKTLNFRIKQIEKSLEVSDMRGNFKDSRYSSPISNPFFNSKRRTTVWIDEVKR